MNNAVLEPKVDCIPDFLKGRDQWVMWHYEIPPGGKKLAKVPYRGDKPYVYGKSYAKSNDPETWSSLTTCQSAFASGDFSGFGYVFFKDDGTFGVDLDNCLDADGKPEAWAQDILDRFSPTYAEVTPSERGFHIVGFGRPLATGSKKWKKPGTDKDQGIEVYGTDYQGHTSGRYFTFTGNALNGKELLDRQCELEWLYSEYWCEHHEEPKRGRNVHGQPDEERVRQALSFIPAHDYALWIEIGLALKAGGMGVEVWDTWSQSSPKYEPGECDRRWATFAPNKITLGSIFHHAKQHGFSFLSVNDTKNGLIDADNSREDSSDESGEWGEMKPLFREISPGDAFPVDALGAVLGPASKAIARCCQVSLAMAGQAVLGAANLVAQSHVDVKVDGRRKPISLFLGTGAESGDRKTSTDEAALAPVREAAEKLAEEAQPLIQEALAKLDVWQFERHRIKSDKKLSKTEKEARLKDLGKAPVVPPEPILTLEDVTVEGLRRAYREGRSSLGIFTNEAATFVNGWAMSPEQQLKTAASLSQCWDGKAMEVARGGEDLVILRGRRLCVNLFMQPEILRSLLANKKLSDQGFLSRVLVSFPESLAGTRLYDDKGNIEDDSEYADYKRAILSIALLPMPFKDKENLPGVLSPRTLALGTDAKKLWVIFYDAVENELAPGRKLAPVKAFAAKAAEHALRLGATFQFISSPVSETIGVKAMSGGIQCARFYLNEQLRLLALGEVPVELQMASELLAWLKARRQRTGESCFCTTEIYDTGPNGIRTKAKAAEALLALAEHGYIRPWSEPLVYRGRVSKACWELREDV